ncbi:polyprenyl synthetase [Streptomyces sp. NPDC046557]|uniref:polyprenyl synthetase n=1 Tax=Streptomyces sp. NPDC046557 TaxID=3155372 RepID=UPI0033F46CF7
MAHDEGRVADLAEDVVALAAGLADLAFSGLSGAVGAVSGLLRRADLGELLADGKEETKARGRLFLDRHAAAPAHLELLARSVAARQAEGGGE